MREGGYWGSGIFCRAIVARLSSLPRGVVMREGVLPSCGGVFI